MTWRENLRKKLRVKNLNCRIFLAEFLGTFLLMVFGNGSVAQSVISGGKYGAYYGIILGYGLAVMIGVSSSIGVSGGHINPAVTVCMAVLGRVPWRSVPFYMAGQYLGSFMAAVLVFVMYYDAMLSFDPGRTITGPTATAAIFTTFPLPQVSTLNTVVDQVFGTALLMLGVMTLIDGRHGIPRDPQLPALVGLLVMLIISTFSYNCGAAINPARDLSPRIFTAMAGWGTEVFSYRNYWFWVPIVCPHVGALLGTMLYQLLISAHWPDPLPEEEKPNALRADPQTDPEADEITKV